MHRRAFTSRHLRLNVTVMSSQPKSIVELERLALQSKELERQAILVHTTAQELNKNGEYEAAKAAYAEMHRLEDLSLSLATQSGCVSCILGGSDESNSSEHGHASELSPSYETLHIPTAWTSLTRGSSMGSSIIAPPNIVRERATGAIISSGVADAAATGVHWIYDTLLLRSIESELQAPHLEFLDPPRSPFYAYECGRSSPYGEQMLVLLDSLARRSGLDPMDYISSFADAFGSDEFKGYRDGSTKGTLRNLALGLLPPGANDAQANCIARLAPLVAMYCGDPRLPLMVEISTRCTQNTDAACAWGLAGARVLERLMLDPDSSDLASHPMRRALAATIEELESAAESFWGLGGEIATRLKRAVDLSTTDPMEASLGNNCHMPNALTSPLQIALYIESTSSLNSSREGALETFRRGIRLALRQGGCCASRCSYLGAILGIILAPMIDREWLSRVGDQDQLESNAAKIASSRD